MAEGKRKAFSKKTRFEVFKRDNFTCVYCGSAPPKVVLEVDHLVPVSKGGDNHMTNLFTACFDCNRGKSNNPIESTSPALLVDMDRLKEKEEQIKAYKRLVNSIKRREKKEFDRVDNVYTEYFPDWELSDKFKRISVSKFIKELGVEEVVDSMDSACSRMHNSKDAIKYFCGICWGKIKER